MDISEFNFTKFMPDKWQEILYELEGINNVVGAITPIVKMENGDYVPKIKLQYFYFSETDGEECYSLDISAFDVKVEDEIMPIATHIWRKIMYKEFKDAYYYALKDHLKMIREAKKQKADEDYENDLNDLLNI